MISMVSLLGTIMSTIEIFSLCISASVIETREFSPDQFFFKIRARLKNDVSFQVRVYYNKGHFDYSYQLFSNVPIIRWDNKEDYPNLPNYPHHYHNEEGTPLPSKLVGDPAKDIRVVLQELERFLTSKMD